MFLVTKANKKEQKLENHRTRASATIMREIANLYATFPENDAAWRNNPPPPFPPLPPLPPSFHSFLSLPPSSSSPLYATLLPLPPPSTRLSSPSPLFSHPFLSPRPPPLPLHSLSLSLPVSPNPQPKIRTASKVRMFFFYFSHQEEVIYRDDLCVSDRSLQMCGWPYGYNRVTFRLRYSGYPHSGYTPHTVLTPGTWMIRYRMFFFVKDRDAGEAVVKVERHLYGQFCYLSVVYATS